MKIKLSANSLVSLPDQLSDINLEYGYSYGYDNNDKSWFEKLQLKFLSMFDKGFSLYKPLDEESKKIVEYTAKAAKFLNEQDKETRNNYVEGLDIQININSTFNKFLKNGILVLNDFLDENAPTFKNKILTMLDSDVGYIYSFTKKMYIGNEAFQEKEEFSSLFHLKKKVGLERATNYLIFHESSHAFEHTNLSEFGAKLDPMLFGLRTNCMILSDYTKDLNMINAKIRENPDWGTPEIDSRFIANTYLLFREIYADIGALLLQRNKDIKEGVYSKEQDLEMVDVLIEARSMEQLVGRTKLNLGNYVTSYTHFTSPGLEHLRELYFNDSLPNKQLTQKEIHDIACKAVEVGISKVLLATITANNDNVGQLKTLLNIVPSELGSPFNIDIQNIEREKYLKGILNFQNFAGENFCKKFEENLVLIEKHDVQEPRAKWHAAFHPYALKNDIAKSIDYNKELEELFGVRNKLRFEEKLNDNQREVDFVNSSLEEQKFSPVISTFKSMREKYLGKNVDNKKLNHN